MSILEAVKEAEENSLRIRNEAAEEVREIIHAAEENGRRLIDEKIRLAGQESKRILQETFNASQEEVEAFLWDSRQKDSLMQEAARCHIPEALRFIVERVEKI